MSSTTAVESVQTATADGGSTRTEPDQTVLQTQTETRTGKGAVLGLHDGNVTGLAIYVDVDETLMRHYGTRQIPIPSVIKQVKALYKQGAELYCWSSMGAAYARQAAETCGVAHCFQAFLPKPQVIVDDQQPKAWRKILHVHPSQCSSQTTVDEYREELKKPRSL